MAAPISSANAWCAPTWRHPNAVGSTPQSSPVVMGWTVDARKRSAVSATRSDAFAAANFGSDVHARSLGMRLFKPDGNGKPEALEASVSSVSSHQSPTQWSF